MPLESNARTSFVENSVQQCRDYLQRDHVPPSRGGQKDYAPDGSWLEAKKLESFHKERSDVLSEQRVRIKNVLSTAEWDDERGKARITYKTGKWLQTMGHYEDGSDWLLPEEALYLMDEGQLQVMDQGLPLSMQEAYGIMLAGHVPLEYYIVYAHLSRYGYILSRFSQPTTVTAYEKKLRLDKVTKKKAKKRKLSLKGEEDGVNPKQFCDIRSVDGESDDGELNHNRDVKVTELLPHSPAAEQLQCTEQSQTPDASLQQEMKHSPTNNTLIGDKPIQERKPKYACKTPYSTWNLDEVRLPHILPSVHKTVKLPKVSPDLLPSGISSSESAFSPVVVGFRAPVLEFSFGPGEMKTGRKCRNWGEYKAQQRMGEQDVLAESPAGHLWTGDVTPLVHPAYATSSAAVLDKLRIIPSLSADDSVAKKSVEESQECYRIAYDMFKPDKNFTKTSEQVPLARLCIVSDASNLPDLSVITSLHHQCPDAVPLKFAVAESGAVSFFSFDLVNIPIQTSPLE